MLRMMAYRFQGIGHSWWAQTVQRVSGRQGGQAEQWLAPEHVCVPAGRLGSGWGPRSRPPPPLLPLAHLLGGQAQRLEQ